MPTKKTTISAAIGVLMTLAGAASALSPTDAKFATKAAQGGIFEVKSSQIALTKTHSKYIRSIAKRMVKEHSAANLELMTVAHDQKITLPTATDPKHRAVIATLNRLSGTAFDKAYIGSQEAAHTATVKLFEGEIAHGKNLGLTAFATKNLPTIQDHTMMIYQVGSNMDVHAAMKPAYKPPTMPTSMSGRHM